MDGRGRVYTRVGAAAFALWRRVAVATVFGNLQSVSPRELGSDAFAFSRALRRSVSASRPYPAGLSCCRAFALVHTFFYEEYSRPVNKLRCLEISGKFCKNTGRFALAVPRVYCCIYILP